MMVSSLSSQLDRKLKSKVRERGRGIDCAVWSLRVWGTISWKSKFSKMFYFFDDFFWRHHQTREKATPLSTWAAHVATSGFVIVSLKSIEQPSDAQKRSSEWRFTRSNERRSSDAQKMIEFRFYRKATTAGLRQRTDKLSRSSKKKNIFLIWQHGQLIRHNKMVDAVRTTNELNTMMTAKVAATLEGAPLLKRTRRDDDEGKSGTSASAAATWNKYKI